ncbi:MAG TPA: hypothetical protein VL551_35540 [Actinospica sp.]|jgi:hypothetical protein|nr:hypothetical protein [Actinospica sp.]
MSGQGGKGTAREQKEQREQGPERGREQQQETVPGSYQRVLMLLPRGYRERRGAEILGTLLDAADAEGRTRPSLREMLSILSLSLRVRTGAAGGSTRADALGAVLRRTALTGLLLQSAIYAMQVYGSGHQMESLWNSWLSSGSTQMHDLSVEYLYEALWRSGAFVAASMASVLLLAGRKRWGVLLAAVGPLTTVVDVNIGDGDSFSLAFVGPVNGIYLALLGLGVLPLLTAALGFQRFDRRTRSVRRQWIATMILVDVVLLGLTALITQWGDALPGSQFLVPAACVVPAVAFVAGAGRLSPAWPLAFLAAGAPVLALLPRTITDLGGDGVGGFSGVSGSIAATGAVSLLGEVLFAGILAWSLYRNRTPAPVTARR